MTDSTTTKFVAHPWEAMRLMGIQETRKSFNEFVDITYFAGEPYTFTCKLNSGASLTSTAYWVEEKDGFRIEFKGETETASF